MNVGITGAGGFIGRRVAELAQEGGHRVVAFSRDASRTFPFCEETRAFTPDQSVDISGCDALIHLAGENVFGLWTGEKKRRILESRKLGTRRLVDAILAEANPPLVLVSASAVGFYGDTGENETDEYAPAGEGFLAEVAQVWEEEAMRAVEKGLRVVLVRTGIVLGKGGGALKYLRRPFSAGLGGKIGPGRQWMSWIHLDDVAALMLFAATNETVAGPLNAVAPDPIRNVDFTDTLSATLRKPARLTVPAFLLRFALGGFSHELLDSKRVVPVRARAAGFHHHFPSLTGALADVFFVADR